MQTMERAPSVTDRSHPAAPGALMGVVTAAVAIGIAQLVAAVIDPETSPVITVGQSAIDLTPAWLKDFAIRTFGSNDKMVLLLGIGAVLLIAAVAIGAIAVRRPVIGGIALAVFGLIGVVATLTRPDTGPTDVIPTVAGLAAGAATFVTLRRALLPTNRAADDEDDADGADRGSGAIDRRRFFWTAAGGAAVALVAGGLGRVISRRAAADESRAAVSIPRPRSVAAAPPGADLGVDGLSPFITSNDRFYRVDTALLVPSVMAEDWNLRIHGMVDHEVSLTYADLLDRPLIERDITLTCVSNPVGGSYIGTARWIGAPLKPLLEEAGVHSGADQIVTTSVDGFTIGTPTAVATDGRDAMLAVAMNGEPLPIAHGFPVRMIVPGLYGYVSAMKWIVDMELSTFAAFDPYWIQRGWAEQAPIKTESRIDTPRSFAHVEAGTVPIAGVAWAQHVGIARVEVQVDEGAWMPAELSAQDTVDTWRQWVVRWNATPGEHRVRVRATDANGASQTEARAEPFPSGATGLHEIVVRVD
jgi:DMSO/TMAO reductase YedYZ molybdopterin-dependent catalytic subunit